MAPTNGTNVWPYIVMNDNSYNANASWPIVVVPAGGVQNATGLTLSHSKIDMVEGGSEMTLAAIVSPPDAVNKGVIWTSSNPDVARVDPISMQQITAGRVVAGQIGKATITATSLYGQPAYTASCEVTVRSTEAAPAPEGLFLDPDIITLEKYQEGFVRYTLDPEASSHNVRWGGPTVDPAITVDGGLIYVRWQPTSPAAVNGYHSITVPVTWESMKTSQKITKYFTVRVPAEAEVVEPTGLSLGAVAPLSFLVGDPAGTFSFTPTITPAGTDPSLLNGLIWSNGGANGVITVDNSGGYVIVGEGSATITVTLPAPYTGIKAEFNVAVVSSFANPTAVLLNGQPTQSSTFTVGDAAGTFQFMPSLNPAGTDPGLMSSIRWASDAPGVIAITDPTTGAYSIAGQGTATITVSLDGYASVTPATIAVTVNYAVPTGLSLGTVAPLSFLVDDAPGTFSFTPSITPATGTDPSLLTGLIWSNGGADGVITVDNSGGYTIVGEGTATITVAVNGFPSVTATFNVSVGTSYNPPTAVLVGGEATLTESYTLGVDTAGTFPAASLAPGGTDPDLMDDIVWSNGGANGVITVDNDGNYTIVGEGTATITVSLDGYASVTPATIAVTVSAPQPNVTGITITYNDGITDVTLDGATIALSASGGSVPLTVTVSGSNLTDATGASYTGTGVGTVVSFAGNTMTSLAAGTANVTAKAVDGGTPEVTFTVIVVDSIALTTTDEFWMQEGRTTYAIGTPTLTSTLPVGYAAEWDSDGIITANSNGSITAGTPTSDFETANLTASVTLLNGSLTTTNSQAVVVFAASIDADSTGLEVDVAGSPITLDLATALGGRTIDPSFVTWESGDEDTATVTDGVVTAVDATASTVTITATFNTDDGGTVVVSWTIDVVDNTSPANSN
jgi:uncharacterized protein YjdB